MRRRTKRLLILGAIFGFMAIVAPLAIYIWASSAETENLVRNWMTLWMEQATGGRVEIATFHWRLLSLQADAGGVVIHGHESRDEEPAAMVGRLSVSFSIVGLWSPRVLLRDLEIDKPAFHVIVYPDGTTNLPQPRKARAPGGPNLNTLFDIQAGHVLVQHGVVDYENRAASFDVQNRFELLNLDARNVSVVLGYVEANGATPESYHMQTGATELSMSRGKDKPVVGAMEATVDLTRSAAYLRSLRVTSSFAGDKKRPVERHTFEVTGDMQNFADPRWNARVTGEVDLRLMNPVLGYPSTPQGIAHLDLNAAGEGGEFRADGNIHAANVSYIDTGVVATGVKLDAHVHADPRQLLISKIVIGLRQGGQLSGEVDLDHWLPNPPGSSIGERTTTASVRAQGVAPPPRHVKPNPDVIYIPVNAKVTAQFNNVTLDAVLDMVSQPPFQRLGLDARLNGHATANWVKGDQQTLSVTSSFNLTPSEAGVNGEVPTTGAIDAIYTQANGAVDLSRFELNTPESQLAARGRLGAYPLTSPSGMTVDFVSRNLGEFDTVLRDLGLNRNGKSGTAALPVALNGQGEIHGSWTGSLIDPHISGTAKATKLAIEMVPASDRKASIGGSTSEDELKPVLWDSVEASGSYTAERIVIQKGLLERGKALLSVDGTLDATPASAHQSGPAFNGDSILRAHLGAKAVGLDELLPLIGQKLPITGTLDAQIQATGQLHALDGSGWAELGRANIYGEPVTKLRAQGTLAGNLVKISTITGASAAGSITGSGSYDLKSRRFQGSATGGGIDIAKIQNLSGQQLGVAGKLGFSASGSGTIDDPKLEANATLSGFELGGESLGALTFTAHTANRSAIYEANTRLEGAEVDLNGETALSGDFATKAKVAFSHFDIGGILKTAHVPGLTGESALAGTLSVEGPLAHPLEMRGDAQLQQLAVTLTGVHLASQGGVHATMANGVVTLDPLHVTGEGTDLKAQGSLALKDKQQLNIAASGSINLRLAETLDPDLTADGTTTFQVEAHGTLKNPGLRGRIDFQNGSLSLEDVPNGLSQLHGTLEFNQDRLEVKSLTAMSGGGLLSVGGYLAYQHGIYADLSVSGKAVRIRYPEGVSSLADITLHMQGAQNNLQLAGDVLITRFTVSSDLDIAALAAQTNGVQAIAPPDAPSNHIRLDVHVASSPQLNFQNAYAKLAGNVDLHLRGTVASPSLLGRVSITEGSAMIAGTRYELQRGDVVFSNPVRIEPTIDLSATARVEDYDVTFGFNGTPQKNSITWRSDPPLPEADVVALLALGRTENQQRLYTQQQEQYVTNPSTDALLGGALNATVSSRVQKLFGAGSVKVDPNYIGALGNSTSRITVEEQVGRYIKLTYATNVDTTGQQLLQAEIAINRHVSLLVARDESGVFSMVVKATRRFR